MPSANVESLEKAAKRALRLLEKYPEGSDDLSVYTRPSDLIALFEVCAKDKPTLESYRFCPTPLSEWLSTFSQAELLQAAEICVRGAREEIAAMTEKSAYEISSFRRMLTACFNDAHYTELCPQMRDLPIEKRREWSNRLEQIATETERKVTYLSTEYSPINREHVDLVFGVLRDACNLREMSGVLLTSKNES